MNLNQTYEYITNKRIMVYIVKARKKTISSTNPVVIWSISKSFFVFIPWSVKICGSIYSVLYNLNIMTINELIWWIVLIFKTWQCFMSCNAIFFAKYKYHINFVILHITCTSLLLIRHLTEFNTLNNKTIQVRSFYRIKKIKED